jgi:hypothetical protein
MNFRLALLAGFFALAGTAIHAEEFQFTFQGDAECYFATACNPATTGAATITFDFNTLNGSASANFGPYPPSPPDPTVLEGSVPITNFYAAVDGRTVGFPAPGGNFDFGCFGPVLPNHYECAGGANGLSFFDNELWIKTLTEEQFNSFKDPLASIFLLNPDSFCGEVSSICMFDQPGGNLQLFGSWSITPVSVPTPGPLLLFLAGLIGLAISRRKESLGSWASAIHIDLRMYHG